MTSDARQKRRNLRYTITYNVIGANQKTESFENHWLHAFKMFDVTSFSAILSGIGHHFKFCRYVKCSRTLTPILLHAYPNIRPKMNYKMFPISDPNKFKSGVIKTPTHIKYVSFRPRNRKYFKSYVFSGSVAKGKHSISFYASLSHSHTTE